MIRRQNELLQHSNEALEAEKEAIAQETVCDCAHSISRTLLHWHSHESMVLLDRPVMCSAFTAKAILGNWKVAETAFQKMKAPA